MTASAPVLSPADELERAVSDYLSISRGAHLFASPADHDAAEQKAWDRLQAAQAAVAPQDEGANS